MLFFKLFIDELEKVPLGILHLICGSPQVVVKFTNRFLIKFFDDFFVILEHFFGPKRTVDHFPFCHGASKPLNQEL
jgi:hypothetical protein